MLYCSSECGSISIMQLRTIYCNTYVYTFHVCLCLLALTFVCNFTYLLKCSFQIYQKNIVVFIRSSKVWFKTTWCAKGPVTWCNFPGNLQRNFTLKRCKLVTNVWYVKNILVNCDGNVYLPFLHLPRVKNSVASCKKNCTVWQGLNTCMLSIPIFTLRTSSQFF